MFSYTQLAGTQSPVVVPPATIMSDAERAESWIMSLSPGVRAQVQERLREIVRGLPAEAQRQLANVIALQHHESPIPLPLDGLGDLRALGGLGCHCWLMAMAGLGHTPELGLGQWGALVTGLAQIGASVWQGMEMKDLQEDLTKQTIASNERIEAAKIKAAAEAQALIAQAQLEAARLAKEGLVEQARTSATILTSPAMWGGLAAVAAVGVGAFILLRRRKK